MCQTPEYFRYSSWSGAYHRSADNFQLLRHLVLPNQSIYRTLQSRSSKIKILFMKVSILTRLSTMIPCSSM